MAVAATSWHRVSDVTQDAMDASLEKEFDFMCLAIPGQVQEVYEAHGTRMGKVNFGGVVKDVCLAYVPEVEVGDYAIVHVGVAISKVDEESALETLQLFAEMGILDEELAGNSSASLEAACHTDPAPGDLNARPAGTR